jgi:hypothetical protein
MLHKSNKKVKPHLTPEDIILGAIAGGFIGCVSGGFIFVVFQNYLLPHNEGLFGFGWIIMFMTAIFIHSSLCAIISAAHTNKWQGAFIYLWIGLAFLFIPSILFSNISLTQRAVEIGFFLLFTFSCFVSIWVVKDILKIGVQSKKDPKLRNH